MVRTKGSPNKAYSITIELGALFDYLHDMDNVVPLTMVQTLSRDCASGMAHLHEHNIVQRDLKSKNLKPCWFNIHYPQYNCTVHMSYFDIEGDTLSNYIEEARMLAMKHIVKANQIEETGIENRNQRVFGVTYDFAGETATNYQFFLTDSTSHFLRGAMYFNLPPQPDSLAPVSSYIKADIESFISSFSWKIGDR